MAKEKSHKPSIKFGDFGQNPQPLTSTATYTEPAHWERDSQAAAAQAKAAAAAQQASRSKTAKKPAQPPKREPKPGDDPLLYKYPTSTVLLAEGRYGNGWRDIMLYLPHNVCTVDRKPPHLSPWPSIYLRL